MEETYQILYFGAQKEIIEKKSRFLATTYPVTTEEEAGLKIEQVKKQYWDASHHCFAYVIGENAKIRRYSDDGEPQGTAGRPMLEVLLGEKITNCLVVVTRYFGGTLLGTGGLLRAYQSAAKEGLMASTIVKRKIGIPFHIKTDYNGLGKLKYHAAKMGLVIMDTIFTELVRLTVLVPFDQVIAFEKCVEEVTMGQAVVEKEQETSYGILDGKVIYF
ncbi:MAG: hypothetical protein PWP24_619 [Clostridiales bacterium]|nr:hypothetical protein [Clostridiales bacterium]